MTRQSRAREHPFIPRIINPVRIERAVIFAADADIREAGIALRERMPWLQTEILGDPQSAMDRSTAGASVFLFDDTGLAVVDTEKIHSANENSVVALLSYQTFVQCSPPQAAALKYPYTSKADLVFAVTREKFTPRKILSEVIRAAEDLLNINKYSTARRFIFHLVDDEPRWFSQFLPVLYGIIGQRADVMITRTYEESLRFLFGVENESQINEKNYRSSGYADDVVCLITDIYFPRGNDLQSEAGRDLIRLVNRYHPRIPVIIASKAKEARELTHAGFVLPKGDPGSLQKLKEYILNFTGMGDFLIYDQQGRELHRAKTIHAICRLLLEAEEDTAHGRKLREILESYGEKDKFSTWLYMHSYRELGDRLRPRRTRGRQMITMLKRHFQSEIAHLERTPLSIGRDKIFNLPELLAALRTEDPDILQPYSDHDVISSWLDRKGYPELAEELRPIHGSGDSLRHTLVEVVDKWIGMYRDEGRSP
jgi:hypothetical protein